MSETTPPPENPPSRSARPKPGAIVRLDDPKDRATEPRLAVVIAVDADGLEIAELPGSRRHELPTYPVG